MGEDICKKYDQQGINLQNLQTVHAAQYQKNKQPNQKNGQWASLVAQWLGIRLPVRGTWVRALVWEDPTCRGAARPVRHKY